MSRLVRTSRASRRCISPRPCLAAIRKKKSEEQRPLKTPVARAVIQAPAQQLELLALVEKDLRASGLIRELETSVGETFEVTVALAPPEAVQEKVP